MRIAVADAKRTVKMQNNIQITAFGLFMAIVGSASAAVIPVTNASFETLGPGGLPSGGCGVGCSYSGDGIVPGWTTTERNRNRIVPARRPPLGTPPISTTCPMELPSRTPTAARSHRPLGRPRRQATSTRCRSTSDFATITLIRAPLRSLLAATQSMPSARQIRAAAVGLTTSRHTPHWRQTPEHRSP